MRKSDSLGKGFYITEAEVGFVQPLKKSTSRFSTSQNFYENNNRRGIQKRKLIRIHKYRSSLPFHSDSKKLAQMSPRVSSIKKGDIRPTTMSHTLSNFSLSQTQKNFFGGRQLRTENENRTIKQKLALFDSWSKAKREVAEVKYEYQPEQLKLLFESLAFRINSLLDKRMPIKDFPLGLEERISLPAGMQCHYKVAAQNQAMPFLIHLKIKKGIDSAILSISSKFERSNRDFSGHKYPLNNNPMLISYYEEKEKEKIFVKDYIYFTLEAKKNLQAIVQCSFGRMLLNKHKVESASKNASVSKEDASFRNLFGHTLDCNSLKSSLIGVSSVLNQNHKYESIKPPTVFLNQNYNSRRDYALLKREKIEEVDINHKFLQIHRQEIRATFDTLLEKKRIELAKLKNRIILWIGLVKLMLIGLQIHQHVSVLKKKREEAERQFRGTVTIRRLIYRMLNQLGNAFPHRIKSKLVHGIFTYSPIYSKIAVSRIMPFVKKFLLFHADTGGLLEKIHSFNNKISRIQRVWKYKAVLNIECKNQLNNLFIGKLDELISVYHHKGKKFFNLYRKLKAITPDIVKKKINEYYDKAKREYLKKLKSYLDTQRAAHSEDPVSSWSIQAAVAKKVPGESQLEEEKEMLVVRSQPNHLRLSIRCSEFVLPVFEYLPSKEVLRNLVIRTAESMVLNDNKRPNQCFTH